MTEAELRARHPPFARCLSGEPTAQDKQWLRFLSVYLDAWKPATANDPLAGLLALMPRLTQPPEPD